MLQQIIDLIFIGFSFTGIVIGSILLGYRAFTSSLTQFSYPFVIWLVAVMLHLGFFILHLSGFLPSQHVLNLWGFPLVLLHLPFLYVSIEWLGLNRRPLSNWRWMLHAIPYFTYVGYLYYLQVNSNEGITLSHGFLILPNLTPSLFKRHYGSILALAGVIYSVWVGNTYVRIRKKIKDHYANLEKVTMTWILFLTVYLIGLFVGIFLIISLCTFWGYCELPIFKWVSVYLSLSLIFFAIRYQRQREILLATQFVPTPPPAAAPQIDTAYYQAIAQKITQALEKDQVFLDPSLTLPSLAQQLEESPQQASKTINTQFQKNFYQLVNEYRIQHAQSLLTNPNYQHYSILGVAMECGFKSKSTFYKLFKQATGTTPTAFQQNSSPK